MMTRQHFKMIADTIRTLHISELERGAIALHFAKALRDTNPAFDQTRFLMACAS